MYDPDLHPVLAASTNNDLGLLVGFITAHTTSTLQRDPEYLRFHPNHRKYLDAIARSIHLYGGHTIKDRVLGESDGVPYAQLVRDAVKKLELGEVEGVPLGELEERVIDYVIDPSFSTLPPARQRALHRSFYDGEFFEEGLARPGIFHEFLTREDAERMSLSPGRAGRAAVREAGRWIKGQLKGRAIKFAMKLALRSAAAPVGAALMVWDFLGPAYRVTIPVICYIGYLRHRHNVPTGVPNPALDSAPTPHAEEE